MKPYHFDTILLIPRILIIVFSSLVLVFLILTMIKRGIRIRKEKNKKEYQEEINYILFRYIFESQDLETTLQQYNKHFRQKGRLFARLTLKSLIKLHRTYSGSYQNNIECFFKESGLSDYSMKMIKSKKWMLKVEGIRNLSELSDHKFFNEIKSQLSNKNSMVKEEAILGMIRLKGLNVLLDIKDINFFFSDWFHAHVIYIISVKNFRQIDNLSVLLEGNNPSIHLLVARIAQYYQSTDSVEKLKCIVSKSSDLKMKKQINLIIKNLDYYKTL